jgi:hypothetical protein
VSLVYLSILSTQATLPKCNKNIKLCSWHVWHRQHWASLTGALIIHSFFFSFN